MNILFDRSDNVKVFFIKNGYNYFKVILAGVVVVKLF